MVDVFQKVLLYAALAGLAAALTLLAVRSETLRAVQARLLALWGALTPFGRVISVSLLAISILYGGGKTNSLPRMMTRSSAPTQLTYAQKKAQNWNIRGAWKDSFWLKFADGWRFPCGTNHLCGVEVISYGELWQTPLDNNAVASLGAPAEIVPTLSSFLYEFTPSNSYRFTWVNAAINRDTNNLITASLELFRNGDILSITNGISNYKERELPFPHDGFGQDDEWVTANFTNATEILSIGYHDWVDAQVGAGLENGLYKLIVTVPETPPETTQLCVGDYSVAVTNTGNYVFLLEKGVKYPLSVFSRDFTNITYSAVDDISRSRMTREAASEQSNFVWTIGVGGFLFEPSSLGALGWCMWVPNLRGSPDVGHLGPGDFQKVFTAVITDCRYAMDALYEWSSSSVDVDIVTPDTQSTLVRIKTMPSWREANLNVTATLCGTQLVSTLSGFSYGTNETPQVWLSADFPKGVALGGKRQLAKISFDCDVETNGTLTVRCVNGSVKISLWADVSNGGRLGFSHAFDVSCEDSFSFFVQGEALSGYEEVEFECSFIPECGTSKIIREKMTVFACYTQPVENKTFFGYQVVNPSFLSPQSNAVFCVDVAPVDIPASKISWRTVAGVARFPSGANGTQVVVRGISGMADIEVSVLGVSEENMHFKSKIIP